MINFDEFQRVNLRVVKIIEAERVEDSDKLVKLIVDLGNEKRQIVAGIGKKYEPNQLINKEIVIIANLEPREIMGLESQGMLLAAKNQNNQPVLIVPDEEVSPGEKIS
ncbi:methionine--tRNA ligase subunit beta [Candidatus Parcubacteria bacterium]|nr:MAG: methionine--tRNA ligase subunit beta [Candidatus Parcubacteria bacterium]